MNTPREILLARHAGAVDGLDAIRARAVAGIVPAWEKSNSHAPFTFLEFLVSLRWHAAAMSVAWVLIFLIDRENGDSAHGAIAAGGGAPAPLIYFTALREYRRELAELAEPPPRPIPPPVPHAFTTPRRETEIDSMA